MIRHATIDELRDELSKGKITEADLREPGFHLDGFCDHGGRRVYVNPRPAVVETLVHELIHRRWPHWSERRVSIEAKRLLANMTDADVGWWYRAYQSAKHLRKTAKRIANDD